MEINNISFDIEDELLPEIEYYEIVSLEEIIKNNPTFIAFSKEDIYNELYNFFKDKNKVGNFIELFYNIIDKQKNIINTTNYIIISDSFKKDLIEEEVYNFVLSIKKSNKIQYKLGQKNKDKLWFILDYNNDEDNIKFKALNKTTLNLSNDVYFNIFKNDEINIPVIGVYYMIPKNTEIDYLNTKIVSHLYKKEKIEEFKVNNETSFNEFIKKAKPKLPLDKIENNNELDYSNLKAFLNKYDIDIDFLNIEDTDKLRELLIKYISNDNEMKDIKYKNNNLSKLIDLKNNKFSYYDILKNIITLLDITIKSNEKYNKLLIDFNDQKNVSSLLYNNINDIIKSEIEINDIIENIKNFKKNIIIENNIKLLIDYQNIDIDVVKSLLIKLENDFNKLKLNYKDIYNISFNFEKEENEIKIGNDIKNYEGVVIKNENNFEEFKYNDDDININLMDDVNDNKIDKYYNTYLYKNEEGFLELIKIILPIISNIYKISNISLNFDLLCNMLFNKYRGISTKKNIISKIIDEKKIITSNEYINNITKILPKNVLIMEEDGDPLNSILKDANKEYVEIIKESIFISLIWWSLQIQKDINDEIFIYNENKLYVPSINYWNLYGYPYKSDGSDGVLIYIFSILEYIFKENNINYENDDKMNDYLVSLPDNLIKYIKKYTEDNYKNELKQIREYKNEKKNKKELGKEYQKQLFASIKNNKYDKILDEYVNALLYLPSVKNEKIHKYLLGCCLQKIDNNFKADTDLIGVRNDLIAMKKTYSKNRELNKPRYLKYHPTLIKEEEDIKIKKNKIDEITENINYNNTLEDYLKEIKGKNILLPDMIINDILLNPKNITKKIEENINLLINTSSNKKGLLELFNKNISNNYKNILLSIKIILFKNLNDNKDILELCIFSLNDIINKIDIIKSLINDNNKNEVENIILYIISRSLCLPSNPDKCKTNILKPEFSIKQNIILNISNEMYLMIIKIIKSYDILTLEKQIEFINKIREENKNIALSTMNKMTDDERNINRELKKLGINNIPDEDDEVIINEEENKNDEDIEEEGEEDFEIENEDDPNIEELSLDRAEYGFIYS